MRRLSRAWSGTCGKVVSRQLRDWPVATGSVGCVITRCRPCAKGRPPFRLTPSVFATARWLRSYLGFGQDVRGERVLRWRQLERRVDGQGHTAGACSGASLGLLLATPEAVLMDNAPDSMSTVARRPRSARGVFPLPGRPSDEQGRELARLYFEEPGVRFRRYQRHEQRRERRRKRRHPPREPSG
jgi:hypothetical protein